MKALTVVAATVTVVSAGIPSDTACQSACGLVATAADCRHSGPQGNACSHLVKTEGRNFVFTQGVIAQENRLTIAEATARVIAPENNCFAMYYDVPELRATAAYCAENNVCPGLFWDKTQEGFTPQYKLAREGQEYNGDSAVLCDYEEAEKPHVVEDHRGEIDPCKALCRLSFTRAECALVQREANQCIRLFWSDVGKSATAFSVRAAVGTQVQVSVADAKEKLLAPENNCEDLCRRNPACAASQNKSNCKRDNRTCQDLVYRRTNDLTTTPAVCFVDEPGCTSTDTPVLCQLPEDLIRPEPEVVVAPGRQTSTGRRAATEHTQSTKLGSGAPSVYGGLLLVLSAVLVSLL